MKSAPQIFKHLGPISVVSKSYIFSIINSSARSFGDNFLENFPKDMCTFYRWSTGEDTSKRRLTISNFLVLPVATYHAKDSYFQEKMHTCM